MVGASRSSFSAPRRGPYPVQPPRPPNAWIIYRSQKLKAMHADPTKPKRPQAEVSREISKMWKEEDPAVRALYEHEAELRKAEHASNYPGYRYQPVKKEEKARMRAEKKADRERAKEEAKRNRARQMGFSPNFLPVPMNHIPYYNPNLMYAPEGPSPPLSAASSPYTSPSPTSEATSSPVYSIQQLSSPSMSSSTSGSSSYPQHLSHRQNAAYTGVIIPAQPVMMSLEPPTASTSQAAHAASQPAWSIRSGPHAQQIDLTPSSVSATNASASVDPSDQATSDEDDTSVFLPEPEYINFDIPDVPQEWVAQQSHGGLFDFSMDWNTEDFLHSPNGPLEISIGRLSPVQHESNDFQQEQFAQLLRQFDFSQVNEVSGSGVGIVERDYEEAGPPSLDNDEQRGRSRMRTSKRESSLPPEDAPESLFQYLQLNAQAYDQEEPYAVHHMQPALTADLIPSSECEEPTPAMRTMPGGWGTDAA